MGNFKLDNELLREYPEMQKLSDIHIPIPISQTALEALTVSAAYVNRRSMEKCLPRVEAGLNTINFEYSLRLIKKSHQKLEKIYPAFVQKEREKLAVLLEEMNTIIGNKRRRKDGVYR